MRYAICLLVCVLPVLGSAEASTRTVCSSGCQYTDLQHAINDALPGDVILLRAGETYTGNFVLRAKSSSATSFITIRSDAPASSLPGPGVRLVPEGRSGANTARHALARLIGRGGGYRSTPILRTEPGAHHYRLQFLEIDGTANEGWETLVALGEQSSAQTTIAAAPHSIVLDRMYMHGHRVKGQKRAIALNSRHTDILNSYITDVMHLGDSQAIAGFNGPGPFRIVNNHLEGAGENIMFGGADPKIVGLVPSDIEIRGNHFFKPLRWGNPILPAPTGLSAAARTGGQLGAGTHYFKVEAILSAGGEHLRSASSSEAAVTVQSSGAVALSWTAVPNADRYRVYRGTSSNGQTVYVETPGAVTSFTYTGSGQVSGTPRTSGERWTVKNLLELKNAQRVTVDGNLFEQNWAAGQDGTAIVLTPANQERTAPQTAVRDIIISNNILRKVAAGVIILGSDYLAPSQQTTNVQIVNNVFHLDPAYGGTGRWIVATRGPAGLTIDHNTVLHEGAALIVEGAVITGFRFTNNMVAHNRYGVIGTGTATGTHTLTHYFSNPVFLGNVLAGGPASSYPAGNYFPPANSFDSSFVNPGAGDFRLVASSPFRNAGTDGRDIGVDMSLLAGALAAGGAAVVTPPDETGGVTPPPVVDPGTGSTPPADPDPDPGSGPVGVAPLPEGWQSHDIGPVNLTGSASVSGGGFTLQAAGADIWGTSDAFHYAYRPLQGNGTIVARVSSSSGADPWTKMGVMIRASTDPRSAHAFMLVSKSKGVAFQRRTATGSESSHTGIAGAVPRWVRLSRTGHVFTASVSADGASWTTVGSASIVMPADVLIGLAGTSHDVTTRATGVFEGVAITEGQALPDGWQSRDVGTVSPSGWAGASGGTMTVSGAGEDVWGTSDGFHFAYRALAGDGTIVARVATVTGADDWTKAGVMMRLTLDAGSPHAFMLVSQRRGPAFQRRAVAGGISTHTSAGSESAPRWVRLTREGSLVTAAVSANGSTWTVVGQELMPFAGPVYVGLAVTSHDATRLATATFDNVVVSD